MNSIPYNIDHKFRLPSVDFDRNLVRGRILKLFTIRDDKYARALEEVAGGKLYSIVVETEAVGTALLKKNCFDGREVLIPNNKIACREVPREPLEYVQSVTEGKATHALSLIKFQM